MIKIIGKENISKTPVIYIANHPCSTDVWIVPFIFRRAKVLISEGYKIPILSAILRLFGHIDCREMSRKQSIRSAIEQIEKGFSVFIFPEGKLSEDLQNLHIFYTGFIKIHQIKNIPIIPVTLIPKKIYKINDKLKLAFAYKIIVGEPFYSLQDFKQKIKDNIGDYNAT